MARSARDAGVPAAEDTRDPDILTTEELAASHSRLRIATRRRDELAVTDLP